MAATVTSSVRVTIESVLANTLGLAAGQASLSQGFITALASGVGANQADKVFSEQRTIAASGTNDYDLAGALTDAFGVTVTFARIKMIAVFADSANVNNVVIGNAATNQFVGPTGAAAHTINVRPGGSVVLFAPDATAWPVTAGTGDLLRFANSGAGTSVIYNVVFLGASA